MLAALGDAESVSVEDRCRLAVCRVGGNGSEVPVAAGIGHAADVPQEVLLHRHLAGVEGVAAAVEGGALVNLVGHDEVVGEHAVVDPLPAVRPAVGDRHSLVVVGHELARTEVGAHASQVVALRLEAVLHDVLGIEACLRRVLTAGVDGQHHGDLADRVVVPVDHGPVRHLVLVAVLLRRIVQSGLVEHVLLEVEL